MNFKGTFYCVLSYFKLEKLNGHGVNLSCHCSIVMRNIIELLWSIVTILI